MILDILCTMSAQRSGFLPSWRRFLFSSTSSTRLFWGRPMIRRSRHGNRRNWLMDDPRESRKEEKPSTREGMIDGIHYRETRAIRPHPEESGSFLSLSLDPLLPFPPPPLRTPTPLPWSLLSPVHALVVSCCLFLFLRCLSVCSTLMHLLAYRYNCRAIIKAGLFFSLPPSCRPLPTPSPDPTSFFSLTLLSTIPLYPSFSSLILYLSSLLGPR